MKILPRFIRFRDAPTYLGMDRNRFNAEVRGDLTEIPIGTQGVAFDRLELDAWAEQHKARNGRPGRAKGASIWDARERRASSSAGRSLARRQTHREAASLPKHWHRLRSKKPSATSPDRMEESRNAQVYGVRPTRTFEQAAAKYVLENDHKRSLGDDISRLKTLMPSIGHVALDKLHIGTLQPWIVEAPEGRALRPAPSTMGSRSCAGS